MSSWVVTDHTARFPSKLTQKNYSKTFEEGGGVGGGREEHFHFFMHLVKQSIKHDLVQWSICV